MKKTIIALTALTLGSAALAQTTPMQGSPPNTNTPAPASPDATMPTTPETPTTPTTPETPTAPTTPTTPMTPDAMAPAPAADAPQAAMASPAAPADASAYPPCSRTVTDKCTQTGKRMAHKH